ncbi:MAG: hypothetical protein LC798_10855 [Chloroflexi bacterium]|nr:hypothetical protein [Chloroflexota bacterium]
MPPPSDYRLGPVGNLIRLPLPQRGIDGTRVMVGGTHDLLSGGRTFDQAGKRRDYSLEFRYLDPADYAILEALYEGVYGPGPYALIDPSRINLLTANQSTATETLGDTTGLTPSAGAVVASSTVMPRTGTRSLLWTHPGGAASGVSNVAAAFGAVGVTGTPATDVPVFGSTAYTGHLWARIAGAGAALTLYAYIRYYTAAGVFVADHFGNVPSVTNAAWVQLYAGQVAAPATAAIARLSFGNSGAIPSGHPGVYVADLQFEQGALISTWRPGTGVPRVHFAALTDSTPSKGFKDARATLLELAAS